MEGALLRLDLVSNTLITHVACKVLLHINVCIIATKFVHTHLDFCNRVLVRLYADEGAVDLFLSFVMSLIG